jgi:hypothetical protein
LARLKVSGNSDLSVLQSQLRRFDFVSPKDLVWTEYVIADNGLGTVRFGTFTGSIARYIAIGKTCLVYFSITGTTSGVAGTVVNLTLPPFTSVSTNQPGNAVVVDGGAVIGGFVQVNDTGISVSKYDGSNWGLGAGRVVSSFFIYQIA